MPGCCQTDPATKARQSTNRTALVRCVEARGYAAVNDFQLALKRVAKTLDATGRGADREMATKYREMAEEIRESYCNVFGCGDC